MTAKIVLVAAFVALLGTCPALFAAGLAPGDTIAVSVLGEPNLTAKVVVGPDGTISVPLAGTIRVAELTPQQVAAELRTKLAEYLKDPQVTVELMEQARLKIAISGEVRNPGIYFMPAGSKLTEALGAAGGLTDLADVSGVQVVHPGVALTEYNLPELATPEGMLRDPVMATGDAVVVPRVTAEKGYQVQGCVQRPGVYALGGPVGVWEAITRAGGLAEKADAEHAVISRKGGEKVSVNLNTLLTVEGMGQRVMLQAGDMLAVPSLAEQIFVMGAVNRPGPMLLRQGAPLLEALAQAGGLNPRARPSQAYILRGTSGTGGGNRIPVNLERLLSKADLSQNLALQSGDILVVPEAGMPKRSGLEKMTPFMPLLYLLL